MQQEIYFDNSATTKPFDEVVDVILTNVIFAIGDNAAERRKAGDIGIGLLGAVNDTVDDAVLVFLVNTCRNDDNVLDGFFCHGQPS